MLISQYEMQFLAQEAIKGQALTKFLATNPGSMAEKLYEDLPDEGIEALTTLISVDRPIW